MCTSNAGESVARESRTAPDRQLGTNKALTLMTWLLSAVATVYYILEAPQDGKHHRGTVWHENRRRPSGFSPSPVITSIDWIPLFVLQLGCISQPSSSKTESVHAACSRPPAPVAIYWNGAIMVPHQNSPVARVFANVFVWSIPGYGLFFFVFYWDYTMGFALSELSASLGVAQFLRQTVALEWIFAFPVMAIPPVLAVAVALPA
ncbi:hypothetical protein VTH06DRAFT_394 [Thermothelomyces fergusii]